MSAAEIKGHANAWSGLRLDLPLVLLLAVVVRSFNLDHTPFYDEMYHVLAARSWLNEGVFSIEGGEYARGWLFTAVVGVFFFLFGESLVVARLPSVISGSLLVGVVFLWTRWAFGRDVAWIAAFLLILSPVSIFLSQYTRFYALHSLLFVAAAFCFYLLVSGAIRAPLARVIASGATVVMLLIALHLQLTTLIGVAGLAFWLLIFLIHQILASEGDARRRWIRYLAICLGCGAVTAVLLFLTGSMPRLLSMLQSSPHWGQAGDGALNLRFYHYLLIEEYLALWGLFPVAVVFALARKPAPAMFCLCVFVVALVVHSVGGAKAPRYFAYAVPFLAILWACGLAVLYRFLRDRLDRVMSAGANPLNALVSPTIQRGSILAVLIAFLLLSTPAFPLAYRMMFWSDSDWPGETYYRGAADWQAATALVGGGVEDYDVVLTTSGPMALYYLGRYDIEVNQSNLLETRDREEFSIDHRTGHPVISSATSLAEVMACHRTGLIIGEERRLFSAPRIVPPETGALIRQSAERLPLPAGSRMAAYRWRYQEDVRQAGC